MIRHIITLIWNQWRSNLWVVAELFVVFIVIWFMMDTFLMQAVLSHRPVGFDTEHVYEVKLSMRSKDYPGYIEYEEEKKIGIIEKNTDIGIFGQIFPGTQLAKEKVMIGYKQEVKEGKAQLLMQSEGKTEKYDIEITEIYSSQQDTNKSFQIQVTDPELLAKTGGIVQGMSGSPILQDGKLIGAVTHVFVQDSAKGYGIFIENMLG